VGHVSPTTGNPSDRMKRAGILAPVVLENVARAYSPEEIERGLMDSPGHRANILSTEATHVGVGVQLGREGDGRREMLATQLFMRRVTPPDPSRATAQVLDEINARRVRAHLRPVGRDPKLDQAAIEFSRSVASGKARREDGQNASKRAIDLVGGRYAEVGALF